MALSTILAIAWNTVAGRQLMLTRLPEVYAEHNKAVQLYYRLEAERDRLRSTGRINSEEQSLLKRTADQARSKLAASQRRLNRTANVLALAVQDAERSGQLDSGAIQIRPAPDTVEGLGALPLAVPVVIIAAVAIVTAAILQYHMWRNLPQWAAETGQAVAEIQAAFALLDAKRRALADYATRVANDPATPVPAIVDTPIIRDPPSSFLPVALIAVVGVGVLLAVRS